MLVRRLPQSALVLDAERVLESNPCSEFVLGRDRSDLVDRPWATLFPELQGDGQDSANALNGLMERALAGDETAPHRWRFLRPDGSTIEWELSLSALEDERGPVALALIRDPSEWRDAQLPSRDAFRWEQLGKVSWGIAHDFNNLLTAIRGGIDNALAGEASAADVRQGLTVAQGCTRRAGVLNRRLLDLSREQRFTPQAVELDALLYETIRGLEPLLGTAIQVDFEPHADGLSVSGDPEQLEQALVNLALNARDAMPRGGTLGLSTAEQVVDTEFLENHPWARRGRYVRIDVRDTGTGIPYDLQPRVFEPFFTSKPEGQGIGLGLPLVYSIVKQHRGFIDLDSRPGQGTHFWMLLPVRPASVATGGPGGSRTTPTDSPAVLVVDDEEIVRELAVTALRGRGYRVLQAGSAEEAEAVFGDALETIDVLVADVMLSGLGGDELCRRFRALKPELRVIYTSGYDREQLPDSVAGGRDAEFLEKPYTLRALADKVGELLDDGRS